LPEVSGSASVLLALAGRGDTQVTYKGGGGVTR